MRPARILLLLVAIVAGGLAAYLATRNSGPATVVREIAVQAPQTATQVLVAKKAIGVGERLTATDVEWQPWPDSAVRPEYITIAKTPDAPGKISGAVARFEIFTGEPILDQKLVHSDQGFLSAVLEPGMRGVSVPVTPSSGSGGFIIPNDRVDVVVTLADGGQTTSRVVLSDVKVLAINTRLGETGATGAPSDPADPKSQVFTASAIATLELKPAQADTLINATAIGKISLVLRSVADFGKSGQTVADSSNDNQSVKIIRFGREANVTAGSADQGQATVSPTAYVAPQPTDTGATPLDTVTTPSTTTTNADGSVTVTAPVVTTTTTSTPPAATPVPPSASSVD